MVHILTTKAAGKQGEVSQEPSFLSRKGSETMERCKLLPAAEPSIVRDAGAEGPLGLDQLFCQVVESAEIAGQWDAALWQTFALHHIPHRVLVLEDLERFCKLSLFNRG